MEIISEKSGRVYVVAEAVEPRKVQAETNSKGLTYDILVIFDWNSEGESPVIIDYIFGASFFDESLEAIQDIIAKYEYKNGFI